MTCQWARISGPGRSHINRRNKRETFAPNLVPQFSHPTYHFPFPVIPPPMSTMAASTLACLPKAKPDHSFARPPKSKLGLFLWRRRMWFESTFVLSMLEPWEKILLCKSIPSLLVLTTELTPLYGLVTIFVGTFILVMTGLVKYLPEHIVIMQRRAVYYLWGQEGDERLLWQWLGIGVSAAANVTEGTPGLPGLYKAL
ncbi:hypothetical protein D9615_005462 [Tricholomella constricta]|uniref:Uncharacterized protein n=1 Tax=Tricholomella constricta TaxID=117010 RepID=A0A8H5HE96_9AGAR|nr:hypothetical protein D9615_005462 [Tricholomella constricta]